MRATRGLIVGFFVVEAPSSAGGWLTQISVGFLGLGSGTAVECTPKPNCH